MRSFTKLKTLFQEYLAVKLVCAVALCWHLQQRSKAGKAVAQVNNHFIQVDFCLIRHACEGHLTLCCKGCFIYVHVSHK